MMIFSTMLRMAAAAQVWTQPVMAFITLPVILLVGVTKILLEAWLRFFGWFRPPLLLQCRPYVGSDERLRWPERPLPVRAAGRMPPWWLPRTAPPTGFLMPCKGAKGLALRLCKFMRVCSHCLGRAYRDLPEVAAQDVVAGVSDLEDRLRIFDAL